MINLLPKSAKRSLLFEYWIRVVSVWLIVWSVVLFASAVILLPAYVLIHSQVEVYEESATAALEKVAVYENISTVLLQAGAEARMILNEATSPKLSYYVDQINGLLESGISINDINISRDANGIAPISIQGVAIDRQTLAAFRDRLQADPLVRDVNLPISNLAQDRDIIFSMTITVINNPDSV